MLIFTYFCVIIVHGMYWERDTKQVKKEENEEDIFVYIIQSFRMQHVGLRLSASCERLDSGRLQLLGLYASRLFLFARADTGHHLSAWCQSLRQESE